MRGPTVSNRGHAELTVERVAGQSAVVAACAREPLKLLTPVSRGVAVWACLSSFGGGMVAGDETQLEVEVRPSAACFLGTQASTKVYRNPQGRACSHQTRARIAAGSSLVFAPDVVQAFADASYDQRQEFHLEGTGNLVLVDWLSSGRSDCGEHWAFRRYQSRNEIWVDGGRRVVDSVRLESVPSALSGAERLARWRCVALFLLLGPGLSELAAHLLEEIHARPVQRSDSLLLSASPIRGGALLRVAGESVEEVRLELQRRLDGLSGLLGDNPWRRKS